VRGPLVSIVTPSLNQGRFIEQAIRSVLDQDYEPIEHIVVDGGSADETLAVIRRHPHLRWLSEPDDGQADAINKGFGMARGEIFGWLNADDLYLPGAVSAAVAVLRETGCGLVHGGWRKIDESGATIRDVAVVPFDYRLQLEVRNGVAQPGAFFTREAFESVGGLDASYSYAMDYELWLRLAERFEVRQVDAILAAHRFHPDSKTIATPEGFWPETWRAARSHGARLRSPLFLDYYLPRRHPWAYRGLITLRLLRQRELGALATLVVTRVRRSFDRSQ
jgi:glycosyltransferase involved in cell wall biosynthesis